MTEDQTRDRVADKLLGVKRYECPMCDFETDDETELGYISDLHERVSAGDIMPAGECRQCGALIDGGDQDIIEAGNVGHFVSTLRRLGYTVIEPKR